MRRRAVPNPVVVEHERGARHTVGLLLDDTDEAIEQFRQRASNCDHFEHLLRTAQTPRPGAAR